MSLKIVLVALSPVAFAVPAAADPARPSPAKACAAYDVHILTRLEDDGLQAAAAGVSLGAAITALVEARGACARNEYERGLDLYSRIDLGGPPPLPPSQASPRPGETQ